jgi:hypothetical protein
VAAGRGIRERAQSTRLWLAHWPGGAAQLASVPAAQGLPGDDAAGARPDASAVEKTDSLAGTMAISELRPRATGKRRLRLEVDARRKGTMRDSALDHTFSVNRGHRELIDLVER